MTQTQLMEFAIKGIGAEIEEHEKTVRRGYQILADIENGKKVKATKTYSEIKEAIHEHQAEIERLDKMKFDITWDKAMMDSEE